MPIEVSGTDNICVHRESIGCSSALVHLTPLGPPVMLQGGVTGEIDSVLPDKQGLVQSVWRSKGSGTEMWGFICG